MAKKKEASVPVEAKAVALSEENTQLKSENAYLRQQLAAATARLEPPKKRVPKDVSLVDQVLAQTKGGKGERHVKDVTIEDEVGPQEEAAKKLVAYQRRAEQSTPGGKRARTIRNNTLAQCDQALRLVRYSGVSVVAAVESVGLRIPGITAPEPVAAPEPAEAATEVLTEEADATPPDTQ